MKRAFCLLAASAAALVSLADGSLQVHPTFDACGIEFPGSGDDGAAVEWRAEGDSGWRRAGRLVWFDGTKTWRTSLVGLSEDTSYALRVTARGETAAQARFRTWRSDVPVGRTVEIDPATAVFPIVVSGKGGDGAWVRYTAKGGARIVNGTTNATFAVEGARNVLLDDMTIVGGRGRYAVTVRDSEFVRIRNCDISGWGRNGPPAYDRKGRPHADGREINFDGAVAIFKGAVGTVVERCYVHDPLCRANSWFYSHPAGPEAVMLYKPDHSTVIRWCDFVGSDLHRFNDAVESWGNFHPDGGFNRDADVTGNFMIYCNDDCIELDGGQRNVRCSGNRFEASLCGVSIQGCMMSPVYVWDNLFSGMCDEFGAAGQTVKTGGGEHGRGATAFLWRNVFAGGGSGYQCREGLRSVLEGNVFAGSQRISRRENDPSGVFAGNEEGAEFDLAGALEHPRRPAPFTLDRGRFDGVKDGFEVVARASGGRVSAFRVVWPEAMDWFDVEPREGVVKPGEDTVIRVRFRKERMNDRRHYRGALLVRSPEGLSRPVSFYTETDFVPPLRAEKPGETALYSEIPGGTRLSSEPRVFSFDVARKGRYYFLMRAKCDVRKPGVSAGVDGAAPERFSQQFTPYPSWVMLSPGGKFGNTIRYYDFGPGRHEIAVAGDSSVFCESVVLTDSPGSFEPR